MTFDISSYRSQYKPLIQLGIPLVIGQLGTIILSFTDTIMIGHHSTAELAAAAFAGQMFMLGLLLALGFAYGLTPIIGSYYGRGETRALGSIVRNGLAVNSLVAVLLMLVFSVLYLFLDKLGQPEELLPYMRPYYIVNLISLPFVCWFNVFKQASDGTTDTKTPMWILLAGNLLNILGNWILIYGKLGMPEMGLLGAGLATLLSRVFMAVAIVCVFFMSRRYRPYAEAFRTARITKTEQLLLHRMGWPLGLQMGMESGAWSLCSIIVGWIGASSLAGHQIMLSISQLFFQIYYAISAAVSIRISLFYGQREYDKIMPVAWAGFHINLLVALVLTFPVLLVRDRIGWLFTDSAEVAGIVAGVIIPLIIYQVSDGLQCIFANALRGLSYVKPLVLVAFIAYFVTSIPASYLFGISMQGGLVGVWYSFPLGLTIAAALYYYFFRRRLNYIKQEHQTS